MSAIANLYNVPSAPPEWQGWSFAHMCHHRDIIRRIIELTNIKLDEFVLDPFNPAEAGVWFDQHQIMHQQMDTILGIAGFDLSEVDFKNEQEKSAWIWLNSSEHKQAADTLGIG